MENPVALHKFLFTEESVGFNQGHQKQTKNSIKKAKNFPFKNQLKLNINQFHYKNFKKIALIKNSTFIFNFPNIIYLKK